MPLWYYKLLAASEKTAQCPKLDLHKEVRAIVKRGPLHDAVPQEVRTPMLDVMWALVAMVVQDKKKEGHQRVEHNERKRQRAEHQAKKDRDVDTHLETIEESEEDEMRRPKIE